MRDRKKARRALPPDKSPDSSAPKRAAGVSEFSEQANNVSYQPELDPAVRNSRETGAASKVSTKPTAGDTARDRDRQFRGAITRTIGSTILPGLGLIGTKRSKLGLGIVIAVLVATVALIVMVASNPIQLIGKVASQNALLGIAFTLAVLGVAWVVIIAGTYLVSRPLKLKPKQCFTGAIVVGLLSALAITPMAVASAYAFETARIYGDLFGKLGLNPSQTRPDIDKVDPWKDKERVNILLLGGDSGQSRDEALGIRTDSIMFASIDTKTGNTVLVQIPRNLQNPIFAPESKLDEVYPYGFDDGGDSMISSVWHDVPLEHPELFSDTAFPNADATKWAIEGITGQRMDYFVMINIDGLMQLVDAMGGVDVNVNYPIAKGGSTEYGCGEEGYIPEGPNQRLGGEDAMWFARSRCNSPGTDFGRMKRQSCLVNAVIKQTNPANMATRYEQIARAAGNMVMTDIPAEHVDAIVDLAGRVQNGTVSRLTFVHGQNGFLSNMPNFELMKRQVFEAIDASVPKENTAAPTDEQTKTEQPDSAANEPSESTQEAAPAEATQPSTGSDVTSSHAPVETTDDACAYQHEEPAFPPPPNVPVYTPPATTKPNED